VDTILGGLLSDDLELDEIETRMLAEVRDGLDGTGNLGATSYGMKSYLLPRIGLLKPLWDRGTARRSWDAFRDARRRGEAPPSDQVDRDEHWALHRDALRYLHSLALEECLSRDMPMQFHAGDGEAPRGILRNQDPFLMEEMVRFERDGVLRMPQVILIHAGYPLVGRAAWLTHLYPNCHFELSLATPLIHHGFVRMVLEVMEVVPLSKILFGSDAYHLPELYWLAAKWGRRFLADALGLYVDEGILSAGEAIDGARMILHGNNRRLYHLTD
jgi:predicted TIM-barrel fold metal-dependent hydrolase